MDEFNQLWEILSGKLEKDNLGLVAILLKKIWLKGNEFVFNHWFKVPSSILEATKLVHQQYLLAFTIEPRANMLPLETLSNGKLRPWLD